MRTHVPRLDTTTMPWAPGEMNGLFTKMLSTDPQTGARTALQRIDPAFGYLPPTTAHFHPIDEELFVLKGRFSFDGELWLAPYAYCFHPAETVHGFKSDVAEESWFISRITRPLEFGFVEEPTERRPYPRLGGEPERAICVLSDPLSGAWETLESESERRPGIVRRILSRHPRTGEGSMLVRFPAGWESAPGPRAYSVYTEMFVLEGALEDERGVLHGAGCYAFNPPHTPQPSFASRGGALVYLNVGGPLDPMTGVEH